MITLDVYRGSKKAEYEGYAPDSQYEPTTMLDVHSFFEWKLVFIFMTVFNS